MPLKVMKVTADNLGRVAQDCADAKFRVRLLIEDFMRGFRTGEELFVAKDAQLGTEFHAFLYVQGKLVRSNPQGYQIVEDYND